MKKLMLLSFVVFLGQVSLAADDALSKVVSHFDTMWEDGNITTGRSEISLLEVKSVNIKNIEDDLKRILQHEIDNRNDEKTEISNLTVSSHKFVNFDAIEIANAYDMGNASEVDTKNTNKFALASVYSILKKLSTNKNKDIVTTIISGIYEDNPVEDKMKTAIISLTNTKTKKQVLFFFIEGTM